MTEEAAGELVQAFVRQNPDFTVQNTLFEQQGSNSFLFPGTFGTRPALFKVSLRGAARREGETLKRFGGYNLFPLVFASPNDVLLVVERIAGQTWQEVIQSSGRTASKNEALHRSIANAACRFVEASHKEAEALQKSVLVQNTAVVMEAAQKTLTDYPTIYGDPIFADTLLFLQERHEALVSEPPLWYFDDLSGGNVLVQNEQWTRFVDGESVWQGTESLQWGAILAGAAAPDTWNTLLAVFEAAFSVNPELVLAGAYLKTWLRVVNFHGWNGWQTGGGNIPPSAWERERFKAARLADWLRRTQAFAAL